MKNVKGKLFAALLTVMMASSLNANTNYDVFHHETDLGAPIKWYDQYDQNINPVFDHENAKLIQTQNGNLFYVTLPAREYVKDLVKITLQKASVEGCSIRLIDGAGAEIDKFTRGNFTPTGILGNDILNNNDEIVFGFVYEHQQNVRLEFRIDTNDTRDLVLSKMLISISKIQGNPLAEMFMNNAQRPEREGVQRARVAHRDDDPEDESDSEDEDDDEWGSAPRVIPQTYRLSSAASSIPSAAPSGSRPLSTPPVSEERSVPVSGARAEIANIQFNNVRNIRNRFNDVEDANIIAPQPVRPRAGVVRGNKPNFLINKEEAGRFAKHESDVNIHLNRLGLIGTSNRSILVDVTTHKTICDGYFNEVQLIVNDTSLLNYDNIDGFNVRKFNFDSKSFIEKMANEKTQMVRFKNQALLLHRDLDAVFQHLYSAQQAVSAEAIIPKNLASLNTKYAQLCAKIEEKMRVIMQLEIEITACVADIEHFELALRDHTNMMRNAQQSVTRLSFPPLPSYAGPDPLPIAFVDIPFDQVEATDYQQELLLECEWLVNASVVSSLDVRQIYGQLVERYRKNCGPAGKHASIILDFVTSSTIGNLNIQRICDLFKVFHYAEGYNEETNTNNNETLVYVWHLLEKLHKNDNVRLVRLVQFFESGNFQNTTDLAVQLVDFFKSLLNEMLMHKLSLIEKVLFVNDLDKSILADYIGFANGNNGFLTENHNGSLLKLPSHSFDFIERDLKSLVNNNIVICNALNKFNEIHAYNVPGYNLATNTNIKETISYVYQLCLLDGDFQPLLNVLIECENKTIDELACQLIETWMYLQYKHLIKTN